VKFLKFGYKLLIFANHAAVGDYIDFTIKKQDSSLRN